MAAVVTEWLEWTFLPSNVTYQTIMDYSSSQAGNHHINIRPKHILHFLAYAMIISVIRRGFEATVAVWLVQAAGIIDQRRKPDRNGDLEASYLEKRSPNDEEMMQLGKKLDLRERYVRNWFRLRRNQDLPSIVHKFVETSWRFAFYTCSLCWGLKALSTAPWFYDTTQCWVNYPNQLLRPDMYYYYMSQGGFYISLLFSVTTDIKRKDFWEMVVHHIATIILISMSYLANFVRIGTLIIAVHDISDVFLESAKLFHYAEWRRTADSIFAVFSVTFLGMRLYVYPRYCLYSSYVESTMEITQPWRGVYIFNVFLFVLQGLHIFWASMLIKMIVRMIIKGQVENDERSDVDEEISQEEDEEEEIKKDKVKQNNGVHSPCG